MTEECDTCGTELVGVCYLHICPNCDPEEYEKYLEDIDDIMGDYSK